MNKKENILIKGAREHNLKNIDLNIPRDKLVVITGISGSGKSSWLLTLFMLKDRDVTWNHSQLMLDNFGADEETRSRLY